MVAHDLRSEVSRRHEQLARSGRPRRASGGRVRRPVGLALIRVGFVLAGRMTAPAAVHREHVLLP